MMAIARFQMPDGRVARVEVPEGADLKAIQAELESQYASGSIAPSEKAEGNDKGSFYRNLQRSIVGGGEVAGTVLSSALAEPVAGVRGIAALVPGGDTPTEAIEQTREAMTYQPRSEAGKEYLQATAEAIKPVGDAISSSEDFLGDAVYEKTGSPALAAAAKSIPTLALEILGVAGAKAAKVRSASKLSKKADNLMKEAAPSGEKLRELSTALYGEIDEMGAMVDPRKFRALAYEVADITSRKGADAGTTPGAVRVVSRMMDDAKAGNPLEFRELDTLREMAQGVAKKVTEPHEAMLGSMIVEKIDDFVGSPGVISSDMTKAIGPQVQAKLKVARDLWGRMRRSELIDEAIYKAQNQASGVENGLRTQFRAILNNKKKRSAFKPDELEAMANVVQGTKSANLMKLLGKFGFGEQQATNMLGGSISSGVGAYIGGAVAGPPGAAVGALTTAGAGTVGRRAARRMTESAVDGAGALIRSGDNARDIAQAYLRATKNPNPAELADIFLRRATKVADPDKLDEFTRKALEIAQQRQAELAAGASVGAVERGSNENVIPMALRQR